MKKCNKCGIEKDESVFNKDKKYKDGSTIWCKECIKQYYKENKEKIVAKAKIYNEENKEKKAVNQKQWKTKNKEKIAAKAKIYYEENKEKIVANKKKRKENDPLFKLIINIRSRILKSIKRNGYKKNSKTEQLLGCSFQQLMDHLGPQPSPDYQMDHICPCAQAQNEQELIKLQYYSNFQWLHKDDNLAKLHHITPQGEEMCRKLLGREWIHKT